MKINKNVAQLSALGIVSLLTACGGSSSTVLSPGTNGLPYATAGLSANFNTMTTTYAGIPFKAKASNAISTGTTSFTNTRSLQSQDITVTILSPTQVQLTTPNLATRTLTLTGTTGPNGEAIFSDGLGTTGTFGLAGSGTTLQSIFFGYVNETAFGGNNFSDTFLVSGFETNPTEVAALNIPSATYTGPARMTGYKSNGASTQSPNLLNSATGGAGLNLNVNFNSNQVTGTMQGATDASIGGGTMTLTLNPSTINGNQFSTTFTPSQTGNTGSAISMSNTQLTGTFYGVDAKEVGGTFSADIGVSGTNFPEASKATGFFVGSR